VTEAHSHWIRECAEHVSSYKEDLHKLYGEIIILCNSVDHQIALKIVQMSQEVLMMNGEIKTLLHDLARELER
jgi:hypothetical protein